MPDVSGLSPKFEADRAEKRAARLKARRKAVRVLKDLIYAEREADLPLVKWDLGYDGVLVGKVEGDSRAGVAAWARQLAGEVEEYDAGSDSAGCFKVQTASYVAGVPVIVLGNI